MLLPVHTPEPIMPDQERILCAAIRIVHNDETLIIPGFRHGDCFGLLVKLGLTLYVSSEDQGFLTSKNRYVSRTEAYEIAVKAHQVKDYGEDSIILISEDLY